MPHRDTFRVIILFSEYNATLIKRQGKKTPVFLLIFFPCCVISVECFCSSCAPTFPTPGMLVINNKPAHTHTHFTHMIHKVKLDYKQLKHSALRHQIFGRLRKIRWQSASRSFCWSVLWAKPFDVNLIRLKMGQSGKLLRQNSITN